MRILITGATGGVGRRLIDHLIEHGHWLVIVSRQKYKPATLPAKLTFAQWDAKTSAGWGKYVNEVDAIINLAGAGLADERWTDERKQVIRESRVNAGQAVVEAIEAATTRPKVLIQASAVGYYGPRGDEELTEESHPGSDFQAGICKAWESVTEPVTGMGVRRVMIRSGVVLDIKAGALPRMVMPFRFFAGGPVGSGKQYMSWIHYHDEVNAIRFLMEHEAATGPFNLTAPDPVRNREFARTMGRVMKRPALAPAPAFMMNVLFGEMATVLLEGQRTLPKKLLDLGFEFKFPTIETALRDLLGG